MNKPIQLNLTGQLAVTKIEVVRLKKEIDDCPHDFVERETKVKSHFTGEGHGRWVWAHCQFRYCKTCGLVHKRVQLEPCGPWGNWYSARNVDLNIDY
jgi:hypothetical protein